MSDLVKDELNPKQELFCQMYVNNRGSFGNATSSYALAYDMEIDGVSDERKEAYNVACASGSRLLINVKIKDRIIQLLNDLLKDNIVDAELAKIIMQDYKLESKISAIREYNRIKGRGSDVIEHKFDFTDLIRQKKLE